MTDVSTFITPRNIVWGRGSISYLDSIEGKRALIVTDKTMAKLGTVAVAGDYLKEGGLEFEVFDDVEPEPTISTVIRILEHHKQFNPDVIVGLGGGSAMDASKAFRIFFEHPFLTFEEVRFFGGPPKKHIPPFKKTTSVCIPSTSGTGSEVGFSLVITDPSIPAKCSCPSQENIPNIAILDPDIADSMPKALQANTGIDALTHAISSYISILGSDFSRACAFQAIKLIMEYLPPAYSENNREAKEHVHYAASLAGMAMSNSSGVGVDHIIATIVGGTFHLTHGQACGIVLPFMIRYNSSAASSRFAEIARAVGYNGSNENEAVNYLIRRVNDINKQLEIPDNFNKAGIPRDAYRAQVKGFVEKSFGFPMMRTNPRKSTVEDLEELYNVCYYNEK